jgi:hypothetical protein
MRKLNFLQILFHFIAAYCCIFLFRTISWIYNIRILEIVEKYGVEKVTKNFNHYGIQTTEIWNVTAFPVFATFIGMLIAIIISIIITIKHKWSLINCLVVFIICFAINYFKLPLFDYLEKFHTIRFIDNLLIQLIFTCVIFFVIGIFLFFSKNTNNLIEKSTER